MAVSIRPSSTRTVSRASTMSRDMRALDRTREVMRSRRQASSALSAKTVTSTSTSVPVTSDRSSEAEVARFMEARTLFEKLLAEILKQYRTNCGGRGG